MTTLQVVEFSADWLQKVKDFDCGSEEWAVWAAEWIKAAPPFSGALQSIRRYKTRVWLYFVTVKTPNEELDEDFLVGFSSLGIAKSSIPGPDDRERKVLLIPMLAVKTVFQGKSLPT